MTNEHEDIASFFADQSRRLELRWIVTRYSLQAALFWTPVILAAAWLRHFHLESVYWGLGIIWFYFALPGLLAHSQVIVDVVSRAATGKTYFFPRMLAAIRSGEIERRRAELPPAMQAFLRLTEPVFLFAADTSPLVGIALWCVIVLLRMPQHAHVLDPQPRIARAEIREAIAITHKIEHANAADWARKPFNRRLAAA